MRRRLTGLIVLGLVSALVVAACGGDDDVASSAQSTCGALADFRAAGQAVPLDPTSATQEEFDDAIDDVKSALDDVRDAASDTEDAVVSKLQGAYDEFADAIEDSSDLPIGEIIPAVSPAIGNVIDTWNRINQDLQCKASTE